MMTPEQIAAFEAEAEAKIHQKDVAFFELLALINMLDQGRSKIPAFAFTMYPELGRIDAQAKVARAAVNAWMGV